MDKYSNNHQAVTQNRQTSPANSDTTTTNTTLNINYKEIMKNNKKTLDHFSDSIILLECTGEQCFDLVDILASRLEIIQMLAYKESCEIGLSDLLHMYDSNFSHSNCLHSNVLKTLNLYKTIIHIQCLEQRIELLNHDKLCAMFDLWLKHNSWAQFNGRKKCYMSATNCRKYTSLRFCNNEHNDGMCCDTLPSL